MIIVNLGWGALNQVMYITKEVENEQNPVKCFDGGTTARVALLLLNIAANVRL